MIQELIAAVVEAERQLDEKISMLSSYADEVDDFSNKADDLLSGSQSGIDQKVISIAASTKRQVEETLEKLQTAKSKLEQLEMI